MGLKEIRAKSILRKAKKIDSWFISWYGMNLYRGCSHNCTYCDGRAEKYNVEGNFGEDVSVKVNAVEILKKELDPAGKRKPFKKGYVLLGGGVGDAYQTAEKEYLLARNALNLLNEYSLPVHILTKSTLIRRDGDLISEINRKRKAIVSISFSSVNKRLSSIFEPGVPSPEERLDTISFFRDRGIACGMFLLPVIPFVSDPEELIDEAVCRAKEIGVSFVIFGGMTLKTGRQKDYFLDVIENYDPCLLNDYQKTYAGDKWGQPTGSYFRAVNRRFRDIIRKYALPVRVPLELFSGILDENDLVTVILEHLDYLLTFRGWSSPYGYAAHSISQLKEPLSSMRGDLLKIRGVGETTKKIMLEILDTGSCAYYRRLMKEL